MRHATIRHDPSMPLRGKTVLVVEDRAPARKAYATFLMDFGYRVLEAVRGGEAIVCVRRHQPDRVLMDVALPVLDGVEAAESLRAYLPGKHLRIRGVTGCESVVRREPMRAVCDDLLLKPCAPQGIEARIRTLLAAA